MRNIRFILSGAFVLLISCLSDASDIRNIRVFENTIAWPLAEAIKSGNTKKLKQIAKQDTTALNFKENTAGFTLLMWCIKMEKYKEAEALLVAGADPNARCKSGKTAIFLASEYSWIDRSAKKDSKFVKLLLKHGADPNISVDKGYLVNKNSLVNNGTTPLMNAVTSSFEKVEALVEGGADINSKTAFGETAASIALLHGNRTFCFDAAYFLIVEKSAIINEPYSYGCSIDGLGLPYKEHYPIELLSNIFVELDSDKHKKKMEIVDAFTKQGQDYWSIEKHPKTIERIKKLHPNNWEEYLKKY